MVERPLASLRKAIGLDNPSPLLKQTPIFVFFIGGAIASALVPVLVISNADALLIGSVIITAATVLAAVLSRGTVKSSYINIIPALDFVAVGFLRFATGEGQSIFGSFILLPVVWMASNIGRRYVVYAGAGVLVVTLILPTLLGSSDSANPNIVFRGLITATLFLLGGAIINELSRQAGQQLDVVHAREAVTAADLTRAAEVQRALLPKLHSPIPGYQISGVCIPSKAVGGDFFDWYPVTGGLGFTLGDVMGKGVGAGIIAATARAVIRSARNVADPVVALSRTDETLTTELGEAASFATLFHARLHAADGRVEYVDAGHGLTILVRSDGSWERLESDDPPLGLALNHQRTAKEAVLNPGDMIVSFSDGVLDLYDGTLAAVDRVAMLAMAANTADEIVDSLTRVAMQESNPDDVTVLAVRRADDAGTTAH